MRQHPTGTASELAGERALTIVDAMLTLVELPKNAAGNSRPWRTSERKAMAQFIESNLFGYLAAVSVGIDSMLKADLRRATNMTTPFTFTDDTS